MSSNLLLGMVGIGSCKHRCRLDNFPIAFLMTVANFRKRAVNYNNKHREAGLAKCKNCSYITAEPTKLGTRCPCCKVLLSHSVYHRNNNNNDNKSGL